MRTFTAKLTVLFLLILIISGCKQQNDFDIDTDMYTSAVASLMESGSVSMDITIDRQMQTGSNNFREKEQKQVIVKNLNSSDMRLYSNSSTQLGDFTIDSQETYIAGNLFFSINDSNFYGPVEMNAVMDRFPPIQLIQPDLYNSITYSVIDGEIIYQYTESTDSEQWAVCSDCITQSSSATAVLDTEGNLKRAEYSIAYVCGVFNFELSVSVTYSTPTSEVSQPDINLYTPLNDVLAPYSLEKSYAYLQQVKYLQAQLTENIYSEVDPVYCSRTITIERSGNDATIYTTLDLTDDSRGGKISSYRQTETFHDGSYSITSNDQSPVESSRVDSQDINFYCKTLLTSNILAPRFVVEATSAFEDNTITYTYTTDEALAETVCQNICDTIYNNPAFLDNLAESYDDYNAEYTLTVDKSSGIPLSSGLKFSGKHIISGLEYSLTAHYEQAYIFATEALT